MAKPLEEILSGVEERRAADQAAIAAAEAERQKLEDVEKAELNRLQDEILRAGEGTGDALNDGIIALYGPWIVNNPEIVKRYHQVNEQLKGHTGEPVVIMQRWLEDTEHISFGSSNRRPKQAVRRSMAVGVVNGEDIIFKKDGGKDGINSYLPTGKYAYSRTGGYSSTGGPRVIEDDIQVDAAGVLFWGSSARFSLGYNLGRELDLKDAYIDYIEEPPKTVMDVLVGHEAIHGWLADVGERAVFAKSIEFADMREACRALSIPPIEPATREQIRYATRL